MTAAIPYPIDAILFDAAREDHLVPCHQCKGDLCHRAECPACLGSGYLRPCGRCFRQQIASPCLVCCGLHYTASDAPAQESSFNARPIIMTRAIRSAQV